jgi:hypothetical protein
MNCLTKLNDIMKIFTVDEYLQDCVFLPTDNVNDKVESFSYLQDDEIIDGDIEKYVSEKIYQKRGEYIYDYFIDRYNSISCFVEITKNNQNPIIYGIENNRIYKVFFTENGEFTKEDTGLPICNLTLDSIGRAYCTKYYFDKYKNLNIEEVRRENIKSYINRTYYANDYDTAMCEKVPEIFRNACKRKAIDELQELTQKDFENENDEYCETNQKIAEIDKKIKELINEKNQLMEFVNKNKIETKYFNFAINSNACKYKNLTGKYPKLIK